MIGFRGVRDAFGLVRELQQLGAVAAFHLIAYGSAVLSYRAFDGSLLSNVYSMCLQLVIWAIVLGVPLHRSFEPPRALPPPVLHVPAELMTLQDVLKSVPGKRSFEKHCMLEFAIEALLFVDAVDAFKQGLPDPHPATASLALTVTTPNASAATATASAHAAPDKKLAAAGATVTAALELHAATAARPVRELTAEQARDKALAIYRYVALRLCTCDRCDHCDPPPDATSSP